MAMPDLVTSRTAAFTEPPWLVLAIQDVTEHATESRVIGFTPDLDQLPRAERSGRNPAPDASIHPRLAPPLVDELLAEGHVVRGPHAQHPTRYDAGPGLTGPKELRDAFEGAVHVSRRNRHMELVLGSEETGTVAPPLISEALR